jgi:hypothetical protein
MQGEKMNWHYGQPIEEKEYLCCVRGISKPTVLDWLGPKKGWRKAVGINWLLFDNTRVVCYIGFDEIPMPEGW